ncbi:TetR family transcriptional regulator [Nocardia nova]|uniref:TetR/AcrR family transcriptional regulator n=1 Tax=Nocardia nova TaxID=37330 RepID=UPI000CEA3699|nr:TetR family transcriptional regulator [Nocardia nova]
MAAPASRRLRADAARNHARILRAANELFARRGLEVTLDDVAEAAGVGVGTVYRRFANKQELIAAVFDQSVAEMAEATDAAHADPDTWRGLSRLFEWYCEHMALDRGFGELMLEIPDVSERFATLRERITPMVLRLIDKAVAEGVVRPGIAASDLFAMVTMVEAIASLAEPVDPELWRRYVSILLDGVRADAIPRLPLAVAPPTPAIFVKRR